METGSSGGGGGGGGDDFHGLKFGQKIYFEQDVASGSGATTSAAGGGAGAGGEGAAAAASAAAAAGNGAAHAQAQPPRCQVEGCGVDLSGDKTYYCRHKVCSMHSKAPLVVVAGIQQRFCQQCSRFHQLPEFDQGKRSCRRRLAGHNERRRKPPPGPLSSRYGRLAASFHDPGRFRSFLLDFSYPRVPSSVRDAWPTAHPGEHHRMPGTAAQWQGSHELHHPHRSTVAGYGVDHHAYAGQGSSSGGAAPMYPSFELPAAECIAGVTAADSSCALSLLSTQPWDHSAHSASHNRPPAMSTASAFQVSPVAPSVMASDYMAAASNSAWASTRGRNMQQHQQQQHHHHHDAVMSDVHPGSVHQHGGQFGELELALQQGRAGAPNTPHAEHGSSGAGAFGHHSSNAMNWSL
ncbi:squamosa promoter-binding-like protein 17 isoform X2 [Brachypodium distachyon]|uniref:SBP-type domain-containing protein n=1 Tax=Brachypodium distachyon TaxID=15368 RepID=A0A0Q3PMV7_BRADI|nr:squamosa promoter-binding-like protein 17 isoform X2 [Brachypodium distachyon]KQJ90761.1 hypothetical protein BRADI_4g33770v3 [Brachypodium distachyon]|eukprot:XP_014757598.1 squamosa promoter-binding-like protein 17 isoform X2 [Brachypodium distachyon]